MMEEWQKQAAVADEDKEFGVEDLMGQWNQVWEQEQAQMAQQFGDGGLKHAQIVFQQDNEYMAEEFKQQSLLGKAKQLIEQGKIQEAVLCLEAEVQHHKESSEAWRLLGQLYQENDQDDFAIIAFKQAHECDPYDLDSLMSLGISSTNELEQA